MEKLHQALLEIGAELEQTGSEHVGSRFGLVDRQWATYRWRQRWIRIFNDAENGLCCELAPKNNEASWYSIFYDTAGNFAEFTPQESLEWMDSVPEGEAYADFLCDHIRRLPAL